jgi:hypothetical protein
MKTNFIPSGKLTISEFIFQVCQKNDLKQAYLIIRAKVPVTFKQVKRAYNYINN